jgi:hypothetical protein
MNEQGTVPERLDALAHIEAAIALCDRIAEPVVACHLQLAADLLRESSGALPAAANASRAG